MAKAYRKSYEIQRERKNQELWLQGMYVYDALLRVSPVLHAFAKAGTTPMEYPDKPYCISTEQEEVRQKEKEKQTYYDGLAFMKAFTEIREKE